MFNEVHMQASYSKTQMHGLQTHSQMETQTPGWHWSAVVFAYLSHSNHPLHSYKATIKTTKTKTQKGPTDGFHPSNTHPSLPPFLPFSIALCQMFTFPREKRGVWTDRVRKERNLAEGKGAKAFKVSNRAVTKAS